MFFSLRKASVLTALPVLLAAIFIGAGLASAPDWADRLWRHALTPMRHAKRDCFIACASRDDESNVAPQIRPRQT